MAKASHIAAGIAGVFALVTAAKTVVITPPNEAKLITRFGDPVRGAPSGLSTKIPWVEGAYTQQTDARVVKAKSADIALQNGTITAENTEAAAIIRFNGTREERNQTLEILIENARDVDAVIQQYLDKALRDVVRTTVVATDDNAQLGAPGTSNDQGDAKLAETVDTEGRLDFMNSEAVGAEVAELLQSGINKLVPSTVTVFDEELPRIEVLEVKLGDFDFDVDYQTRRDKIANARAEAIQAGYDRVTAEEQAAAAISAAGGQAGALELVSIKQAEAIEREAAAAGGAGNLVAYKQAEKWNGELPETVVTGDGAALPIKPE